MGGKRSVKVTNAMVGIILAGVGILEGRRGGRRRTSRDADAALAFSEATSNAGIDSSGSSKASILMLSSAVSFFTRCLEIFSC